MHEKVNCSNPMVHGRRSFLINAVASARSSPVPTRLLELVAAQRKMTHPRPNLNFA